MSLGTGAINVCRGPEHFRPRQGGLHGNPMSRNLPCKQLPTGTVTLNQISGKYSPCPPYLPRRFETSDGEGGMETQNRMRQCYSVQL